MSTQTRSLVSSRAGEVQHTDPLGCRVGRRSWTRHWGPRLEEAAGEGEERGGVDAGSGGQRGGARLPQPQQRHLQQAAHLYEQAPQLEHRPRVAPHLRHEHPVNRAPTANTRHALCPEASWICGYTVRVKGKFCSCSLLDAGHIPP